jgi:hypothetical protein
MLFREVLAVHSETNMKPTSTVCKYNVELIFKACGIYNYHWALNGKDV